MKTKGIALTVLGLVLTASSGLRAEDVIEESKLDEQAAKEVLNVLIPPADAEQLKLILGAESLDELTPEQQAQLRRMIKAGAETLGKDSIAYM